MPTSCAGSRPAMPEPPGGMGPIDASGSARTLPTRESPKGPFPPATHPEIRPLEGLGRLRSDDREGVQGITYPAGGAWLPEGLIQAGIRRGVEALESGRRWAGMPGPDRVSGGPVEWPVAGRR
jgi:hypothetical protein